MKKLTVAAGILLLSATAFAQSVTANKVYGEVGYHHLKLEDNNVPGIRPTSGTLSGIIGYKFHDNLSAELLLATGLSTKNVTYLGTPISVKHDHTIGLMIRPSVMFSDQFEGFVRLGYGRSQVSASAAGVSASGRENSVIWGIGANYHFTKTVYGQLSYTSFHDKGGSRARGIGASIGFRF